MTTIEPEQLDLLRSTVREVFSGGADLPVLGELGLLGLLTAEEHGGSGWNVVEACAVMTEAGRALSPLPLAGTLAAAAALAGSDDDELLPRLLAGEASAAFVERPGAAQAGGGWRVSGEYLLPGIEQPAAVVVASPGAPLVAVRSGAPGVALDPQDDAIDSSRGAVRVTLADAAGRALPADRDALADAAVLLACADTLGALAATSGRVTRYLSEREAFGQPLAAFQALQHRLADLDILVAEAEALVTDTAVALATRAQHARHLVGMTHAFLVDRCVAALDDCVQLSGGIGVTWEWPVHHAVRRSLANAAARVRTAPSREQLRAALDVERPGVVGTEEFRQRVRQIIAENDPPLAREGHRAPTTSEQEAQLRAWYRALYDNGLLGASWPVEWGGSPDHRPLHQLIVTEELVRARAPRPVDQVQLASHVLLHFGTEAQKRRYLPRIRTAEDVWCQLFSEPDAGSDLAGIRTRAKQRDDGTWVLDGQKTWTTDGHWAQYGLALVRTSTEAKRHAGLTIFVVPMDALGVEVRPIRMNSNAVDINETFLDGVVLGPEHVVGEVGQGWAVAMAGLDVERVGVGANVVLLEQLLQDVVAIAEALRWNGGAVIDDPAVRAGIQRLMGEFEAARAFVAGHVERVLVGREGEAEGPIAKVLYTEAYNEISRFGTELVTTYGPVPADVGEGSAAAGRLQDAWLWSRVLTISGGSSEVMRNIIAKRRLRLPSGR